MYTGLLGVLQDVSAAVCWVTPFTFVFCLVYAVREAVRGGDRDIALAAGAAVSLFVLVAACLLN